MEIQNNQGASPATERAPAPATTWVLPRQKQVERHGNTGSSQVHHYPQVRGGVCEFCGVIDPNQPSQYQYKLCPHYRGQNLRCTYCPEEKDVDDIAYHSTLNITDHPDNPNKIVVVCNSYECTKAHEKRFKVVLS